MRQGTAPVKSKDLPEDGQCEFMIYDSPEEFASHVGEALALKIINGAVETAAKNDKRRELTTGSAIRQKDLRSLMAKVPAEQVAPLAEAIKANDIQAVAAILAAAG